MLFIIWATTYGARTSGLSQARVGGGYVEWIVSVTRPRDGGCFLTLGDYLNKGGLGSVGCEGPKFV